MAYNKTLALAEDDEKKKALADSVAEQRNANAQIVEQDRSNWAEMFQGERGTPSMVEQPVIDAVNYIRGTTGVEEPRSPDLETMVLGQGDAPVTPEQAKAQAPSVLRQSLDNMKLNQNVGPAPVAKTPTSAYATPENQLEEQHGLPMGYLSNTARIESNGNPNAANPNSSAKGLYQFTDATAKQYGLKDPMDPAQSTDAMIRFSKDNQAHLTKVLGREPTGEEMYLAHQQGATGALKIIQSDPNARAVDVLGRDKVLLNGGNENMTVGEFKDKWAAKYNQYEGNATAVPEPQVERVYGIDDLEANNDKGISVANQNGIPPAAATAASRRQFDENGRFVVPQEEGMNFNADFQHRNRETSDSGALWQGALAGAIAVLGTALMGGDSRDMGTAFFLAGADRFGTSLNESHRYKNLAALTKMGYTPESIEAYIESGDRSQLAKHQIGDWKEYPDGSGDMYRSLPDGSTEFRQGQPKWETVDSVNENGETVRSYYNQFYGQRNRVVDGKEVPFTHVIARQTPNRLDIQNAPQVWVSPDGKQNMTVYTTPTGYVSASDRKTAVTVPDGWALKEKATTSSTRKAGQPATDDEIEANRMRNSDVFNTLTNGIYNADGSLNTTPPVMDTRAGNFLANSNWANAGGGRGVVPAGENWLTSGNTKGEIEMRKRVTDAKTMQAQVRNMAIQIAKDSGASGINTVAEIRLFAESFPPIDFSSYSAMVTSMDNLRKFQDTYSQNYRLKVQQSKEVMDGKAGTSTLGNVNSQNETQEKAAWKEMEQYYGGGQGAQYLTDETVNAQNGQGNPKVGVTASGYRYTKL